jgi:hypothetical protein
MDISNEMVATANSRSPGAHPGSLCIESRRLHSAPWFASTPLGRPWRDVCLSIDAVRGNMKQVDSSNLNTQHVRPEDRASDPHHSPCASPAQRGRPGQWARKRPQP